MTYRVVHTNDVPRTDVEGGALPAPLGDVRRVAELLETDDLALDVWHVEAGETAPVHPATERDVAYLVLDGEFTLAIGAGETREEVLVETGCFVTVSDEHAHGFENRGNGTSTLLSIAAPAPATDD